MHNAMSGTKFQTISRAGIAAGVVAGMLSLGLLGCESGGGSGTPSSGSGGSGGAPLTAPPVANESWAKLGYRLDWQGFASVPPGGRITQFVVSPSGLVAQETGSRVTLMEPGDGSMRWTNQLSNRLTKYVGAQVVGDRVLVASDTEYTGLDAATGAVVSRQPFARVVNTPGLILGGAAVFGSASGEIMGHLLSNGVKLWGFQTAGAITHGAVSVNGVAGIVSQSGDVLFLDPQTGVLYGRARMFKGVETDPVAGDGAMYIAGLDQSLWAFEPSGRVRWRFRTEFALRSQPTFHAGAVYCEIPTMGLVALDAATGTKRWNNPEVRGVVVAQRQGMLVVFAGRETMLVDPVDGTIVAREAIAGVARLVPEQFEDGALYAVSSTGTVLRLVPRR